MILFPFTAKLDLKNRNDFPLTRPTKFVKTDKDRSSTYEGDKKTEDRRRQPAVENRAVLSRRILQRQTAALSRTSSTLSFRPTIFSPVSDSDSATSLCNLFLPSSIFFLFLQLLDSALTHESVNKKNKGEENR